MQFIFTACHFFSTVPSIYLFFGGTAQRCTLLKASAQTKETNFHKEPMSYQMKEQTFINI